MTLDPRTIEACAKAITELDCMYVNEERIPYGGIPADPETALRRITIQECEETILALLGGAQRSGGSAEGRALQREGTQKPLFPDDQKDSGLCEAGIKPGPSGTPAGVNLNSHPGGESDLAVTQNRTPAGTALTEDERKIVELARDWVSTTSGITVDLVGLLAIIARLTTSSPAEVSEEELAEFLFDAGIFIDEDDFARELLAKFTIGRR